MGFDFGSLFSSTPAAPEVEVFTDHPNNDVSPLVIIGGIHIYPEGFGLCFVVLALYIYFINRNYRPDKPKKFYKKT